MVVDIKYEVWKNILKYQKEVFRNFSLVMQFGITMIIPILLCTFLGIFLDRLLGTSFIVIILFFLGALAGFRNIYILVKDQDKNHSPLGSDAQKRLDDSSDRHEENQNNPR